MRRIAEILVEAGAGFLADDGWAIASHIALATLTSLFPFLIFVAALAGVLGARSLADEAALLIFDLWPAAVAGPIANAVRDVLTTPRGGLLTFGAAFALYFASSAIEALRTGLNRAYDFEEPRPWWLLRLHSIAFTAIASIALVALSFLIVLAPLIWSSVVTLAPALAPLQAIVTFTRLSVTALVLAITLLLAHQWLPARRLRFREIAPGAIVTFVLSIGFGEIFGAYLNQFARNYVSTYAGLASGMVVLAFLNFVAAIFIFGGELNAAIRRARGDAR